MASDIAHAGCPHTLPAIALAPWYTGLMTKNTEKPVPFMVRLYKKDKAIVRKMKAGAEKNKKRSDADVIRYALRFYAEIQSL
jgi:hypothetical protein